MDLLNGTVTMRPSNRVACRGWMSAISSGGRSLSRSTSPSSHWVVQFSYCWEMVGGSPAATAAMSFEDRAP